MSTPPRPAKPDGHHGSRAGWRYRRKDGLEFERVAFFTDAVYAIAMTLLIVSIDVPTLTGDIGEPRRLLGELRELVPQFFSFFLAFLLLGRYWLAHHELFSSLVGVDRTLMSLNLVYLAFIAFLPFPTELVGKYEPNPVSVVLFALCLSVVSTMEAVMFRHAVRTGLSRVEIGRAQYRYGMIQSLTPVALFLISIPIAFWEPSVALFSWLLSIPIGVITERRASFDTRAILRPVKDEQP